MNRVNSVGKEPAPPPAWAVHAHARYLGGDLEVVTMGGHGTDVFVTLKPADGQDATGDLLL